MFTLLKITQLLYVSSLSELLEFDVRSARDPLNSAIACSHSLQSSGYLFAVKKYKG
jgi:hypothetical protein